MTILIREAIDYVLHLERCDHYEASGILSGLDLMMMMMPLQARQDTIALGILRSCIVTFQGDAVQVLE